MSTSKVSQINTGTAHRTGTLIQNQKLPLESCPHFLTVDIVLAIHEVDFEYRHNIHGHHSFASLLPYHNLNDRSHPFTHTILGTIKT